MARTRRQASSNKKSTRGSSRRKAKPPAEFLERTAEPVRDQLAASAALPDFLQTAGTLTLNERKLIVEQAILMLEQNYVHLPLKAAMHAVNPLQRLRLLRTRLDRATPATADPEWRFHAEMSEIFHSVRDLHTNYILPTPFSGKTAYLPFLIEEFTEDGKQRFVVSKIVEGFTAPGFGRGVEVTYWNGMPISRAVDINAARFAGSNAAARRSRGVQSLTIRPLRIHLPPDEEWVTVTYVGLDGAEHELRQEWLVTDNLPPMVGDLDAISVASVSMAFDLDAEETNLARKMLFAPQVVAQERARTQPTAPVEAPQGEEFPSSMPGVFRARSVETSSGTFGHIRIFTFSVDDPDAFVAEFVRLLGLIPQNGLILDVRGNGGGHIFASEFALQTLTPRRIVPEPVQFISTPVNLAICRKHKDNPTGEIDLGPWFRSLDQAPETGSVFSAAFSITPEVGANAIGQRYYAPVVLVTDARCYSATDIFAAGFQDHRIGPVLGTEENTGAGGANVWTHGLLKQLYESPTVDPSSPYKALPKGANMRVSIRRTLRVGDLAGTPVEDLGVVPDHLHRLTREDVLTDNVDLLNRVGELLAALPVRKLDASTTVSETGRLRVKLDVAAVDRVDVFVDGRPRDSVDVSGGATTVNISGAADAKVVRLEGYEAGSLVAARNLEL
jgi:Peptidase family S41